MLDPETGEERFARVKVPELLPRFLAARQRAASSCRSRSVIAPLPRRGSSRRWRSSSAASFRVTRDADFEVSDEADDLLEAVELELRRRRFGDAVRLEVSGSRVGAHARAARARPRRRATDQVYPIQGLLDLADLRELAALDRPELKVEPWAPVTHARLREAKDGDDLFSAITARRPARPPPVRLVRDERSRPSSRAAARDPTSSALKTTVYRTSDDSPLVPALIEAAEDGQAGVCLVELKARFDERRNIDWSRALEQAGVHVVYGFPNLKIHAKTTLVVRREGDGLRRYVHIGTGNYHASTARATRTSASSPPTRTSPPTSPTSSTT